MKLEADLRVLVDGLGLLESPRWHDGRLWFADWTAGEIIAVDLEGQTEVMGRVASLPLCFDWLADGRLIAVDSARRLLLRQEPDGSFVTHADLSAHGPYPYNDIAVDGHGNVYVNNINFDFPEGEPGPGFITAVAADGSSRRVADDLAFPNGMVVTPDNATLIVAESYGGRLTAYDIHADGALSNRRVWADLGGDAPDGICLDAEGAVWYASVPGRHCVRVREGGEVLQGIELDRGCFACALGGDTPTLFITACTWGGTEAADVPEGRVVATTVGVPGTA